MRIAFAPFLALALAATGCGSGTSSGFGDGGDKDTGTSQTDGGPCNPDVDPFCFEQDAGGDGAAPPCENLECQIVNCGTSNGTTISGKVYDPAGKNPLYNVFVYVPNRPLDPIPDNGVVCQACQAPASGKPIASAVTNEKGEFLIKNAPTGTNVPLVMQVGKWRRVISVPQVKQCVDNPLTDPNVTRLPKKHKEGSPDDHIPRIAYTQGCDKGECFLLKRIGIDPAEFTGPSQNGRVHVYGGNSSSYNFTSGIPGGVGNWSTLYNSLTELKKYDIVFSSCECDTYNRGQGYQNVKAYLESGGRFFGTHYYYNLFASQNQCQWGASTCQGPTDFNQVAAWGPDDFPGSQFLNIDTTHPKGKALNDWLQGLPPQPGLQVQPGQVYLTDLRGNATGTNQTATRYLFNNQYAFYFSFNTPTTAPPMNQCGRGVFSAVHLSGTNSGKDFATTCASFPNSSYAGNELALEYLFFDLSSCVGDDTKPPPIPPPN